jgi:phosphatidylethanolamine-binding protein (PEBP) family uncharacterized protein
MNPKHPWRANLPPSLAVLALFLFFAATMAWNESTGPGIYKEGAAMTFSISSSSFQNGSEIPKKFTCDGADASPELHWSSPPAGTQSLALIADDPDAPVGTWTHWVLFDLSPQSSSLPEGAPKVDDLPAGGRQ